MTGYRDDKAALRHQKDRLEADLDEAESEIVAHQERLVEAEQALATREAELAAKDAELARLRHQLQPPAAAELEPNAPRPCPACRRENKPHYKFCLSCGTDMSAAPAPQAWLNAAPAPQARVVVHPQPAAKSSVSIALLLVGLLVVVAILGAVVFAL